MEQNKPDKTLWQGFTDFVAVAWPLIIVICLVLIGMYWEIGRISYHVGDVNRQWQSELQKYYCYPRDQTTVNMPNALASWSANLSAALDYDNVQKKDSCLEECYAR